MPNRRKPENGELHPLDFGRAPTPLIVAEGRLKSSACVPLRELACRFTDGKLVVRGTVPTKYSKRLALACLVSIEGVQMIIDMISVQFPFA